MPLRIEIRLDGPPRGKGAGRAFATTHGARIFTDDRTRKYEAQLRYAGQQVMADRPPIAEPVTVEIEARFQIPTSFNKRKKAEAKMGLAWPAIRPDVENLAKLMDGLNGIVWQDDRQIVVETIRKIYSEQPGLTIIVETMNVTGDELQAALSLRMVLKAPTGPLLQSLLTTS